MSMLVKMLVLINFSSVLIKIQNILKINMLLMLILSYTIAQETVVNLPQGRIVGTKVYMEKSLIPIEIYYGIPYAIPPTGRYRFSAPERHSGWKNTFYAYRLPPRCPSNDNTADMEVSEDCLFLNIWVPRLGDDKPLAVVILLYSESWTKGGVSLPCQDLAAEGVIVVTIGYRLHWLAFLNLGFKAARGNLALLDQYLAFLWVRDNISAFGGDPTTITVLGHSAGADSVLYHLMSPRSFGLFQRAIIMSPRDIWNLIDDRKDPEGNVLNASREVAHNLGCTSKIDQEILHCMRTRPLSDILSIYSKPNWNDVLQPSPDKYLPESEQYLPTSIPMALSNSKQTKQCDILLGTTNLEALNYNDETFEEFTKYNASYMSEFINKKVIPQQLMTFSLYRPELVQMFVEVVKWEYWKNSSRQTDNVKDLIEYLAKVETLVKWSTGSALLAARLARRVTRLYVYRYSVPSTVDLFGRKMNFSGAVHGADLISLLGEPLITQIARRPSTIDEKRQSYKFRRLIVNFIKYGYPENERIWQRYKVGYAHVYEIDDEDTNYLKENNGSRDLEFWLHYLPELLNAFNSGQQSEQHALTDRDGGRLRGGVFAMCGVAVVLLVLLCLCAIILHRQRSKRRFSISDDTQHKE